MIDRTTFKKNKKKHFSVKIQVTALYIFKTIPSTHKSDTKKPNH